METTTWIYTDYNYDTETWNVIEQSKGKKDTILRSFKREGNALNYEMKLFAQSEEYLNSEFNKKQTK